MERSSRLLISSIMVMLGFTHKALADDCTSAGLSSNGEFEGYPSYYESDGSLGGPCQCVEFVKRVHGISGSATGCETCGAYLTYDYIPAHYSGFTSYPNKGSVAPETGDIIVFSGGASGHVGIVNRGYDASSTIEIVDQNRGDTSTDGAYMDCDISLSSGNYTVNNCRGLSSYTVTGWIRSSTYNPITCTTSTYSVHLITAEPSGTAYNMYGYYEEGVGEDAVFHGSEQLESATGSTSNHFKWLTGDVNNDAWDDVVEVTDNGSYTYAQVYTSDGSTLGSRTQWVKTTTGVNQAFLQDYDGDGYDDLILGYANTDGTEKWKYYLNAIYSGSRSFGGTTGGSIWSSTYGKSTDVFVVGDFDGDGKAELLDGRETTGSNDNDFDYKMAWKRYSSAKVSTTVISSSTTFGFSGDEYFPADVDNDGSDDLVRVGLNNSSVPVYWVKYSSSTGLFGSSSSMATDVGAKSDQYSMYFIDYADSYIDLLRVYEGSTSGSLYLSRGSKSSSTYKLEDESTQSTMLTGMSTGIDYLFGYFGDYDVEVCE